MGEKKSTIKTTMATCINEIMQITRLIFSILPSFRDPFQFQQEYNLFGTIVKRRNIVLHFYLLSISIPPLDDMVFQDWLIISSGKEIFFRQFGKIGNLFLFFTMMCQHLCYIPKYYWSVYKYSTKIGKFKKHPKFPDIWGLTPPANY